MKSDPIVDKVVDQFHQRSEEGQRKYGTTLADNNLTTTEWIQHAQEEAMDFILYLERLKTLSKHIEDEQKGKKEHDGG